MGYKEMYEQAQSMYEKAASISEDISKDMNALIEGTISGAYTNSEVSKIRNYTFSQCLSLTTVSFPECTYIGGEAFFYCPKLSSISFPNCTSIDAQAFDTCTSLTTASFPKCQTIGVYAFSNCTNLFSLYLTGSSVARLNGTTAFGNTPMSTSFGGVYGSIFVPASLYASYISANNWSVYSSRIVSLTDEQISALG